MGHSTLFANNEQNTLHNSGLMAHIGKSLVSHMAELVWPARCVVCDRQGSLVCASCFSELPWIEQEWACKLCAAPHGYLSCTECARQPLGLDRCVCALEFNNKTAAFVRVYKDQHERRLAPYLASFILTALDEAGVSINLDGLCFVPATKRAYVRRGFDHMRRVSELVAQSLGIPLLDVLMRNSKKDQRELDRKERKANIEGSVICFEELLGLELLLLDDVITTGASLGACAQALRKRGATRVVGAACVRVW